MDTHKGRTARSGRLLAQSISPLLKTPFEQQPVYKASIELPLPNCSSNAVLLNKFDEYFGKASGLPRETKTMFQSSRTVQQENNKLDKLTKTAYPNHWLINRILPLKIQEIHCGCDAEPLRPTNHLPPSFSNTRCEHLKRQVDSTDCNNFLIEQIGIRQLCQAKLNKINNLSESAKLSKLSTLAESTHFSKGSTLAESLRQGMFIVQSNDQKELLLKQAYQRLLQTRRKVAQKKLSMRSREDIPMKYDSDSMLYYLNPTSQSTFRSMDLTNTVLVMNRVSTRSIGTFGYFNVYVDQGNNSELLKLLIRKRTGWRVVEIPQVANLIWTQTYHKHLLEKRPNRRCKVEEELPRGNKDDEYSQMIRGRIKSEQKSSRCSSKFEHSNEKNNFSEQLRKLVTLEQATDISTMHRFPADTMRTVQLTSNMLLHNHFPSHRCVSDKKHLLSNLDAYYRSKNMDTFEYLPASYHIRNCDNPQVQKMKKDLEDAVSDVVLLSSLSSQIWIVKPAESSNRGRGIIVCQGLEQTLSEIYHRFEPEVTKQQPQQQQSHAQSQQQQNQGIDSMTITHLQPKKKMDKQKSVILQLYIRPLLYHGRKFDIRSYLLVTLLQGRLRGYFYDQCYIRTCSRQFDLHSTSKFVHLTNDAIQALASDYGKHQEGNKVSEAVFAEYLQSQKGNKDKGQGRRLTSNTIWESLKKQMQQRCIDIITSVKNKLPEKNGHSHYHKSFSSSTSPIYFELFGLDFMIDQAMKLWLIEVNTNPCLAHECSRVLGKLIPKLLDNVFSIAVEPFMCPTKQADLPCQNNFIAIFSQQIE